MKAAVVSDFKQAPEIQTLADPKAAANEQLLSVLAAAVYPRVRSQANGTHYTSTDRLPFIPGLDGVGQTATGEKVYFVTSNPMYGALAEKTVVDSRRIIPLPIAVDAAKVAAAMNPAMSAWMALRTRVDQIQGKRVMVLGATGAAGKMAVQISKYLGASEIIGVGRNQQELATLGQLGADDTICLRDDETALKSALLKTADVDIVLDYLWGDVALNVMQTILPARKDHHQLLSWIEIGSMSGATMSLPSAALRSVNLQLIGSGQGSIDPVKYLAELPELAQLISHGQFTLAASTLPLTDLNEDNWQDVSKRNVYTMNN